MLLRHVNRQFISKCWSSLWGIMNLRMLHIGRLVVVLLWAFQALGCAYSYNIIYQWNQVDVAYPSDAEREAAITNGSFIQKNLALGGLKIWNQYMYLSIPRFRSGVPVTLTRLDYRPLGLNPITNLKLTPFPSWQQQEIGNCGAFQFVQAIEIDQFSRMWILDTGRINILEDTPINLCTPKLLIMDLTTNMIVRNYSFPEAVASASGAFLDDLVVGCTSRSSCVAYIANTLQNQLIVYNYESNDSWSVSHPTMEPDPSAVNFTILGTNYTIPFGLDGIGLSPRDTNFNRIFYAPLAAYNIYSVSARSLFDAKSNGVTELNDAVITDHGKGVSQADGFAVDSSGLLYYGRLQHNALAAWNTRFRRTMLTDIQYLQNDRDLGWVDTLAFDNRGQLVFTTDRLNLYIVDGYNASDINFRIIRTPTIGTPKSYMYRLRDIIG